MKYLQIAWLVFAFAPVSTFGEFKTENGFLVQVGNVEIRKDLKCLIELPNPNVQPGSRIPVIVMLKNTGPTEIQLPFPYGQEPGVSIKFVIPVLENGIFSNSLVIGSKMAPSTNEPDEANLMWIGIAPHSERRIQTEAILPHNGLDQNVLTPGKHELQCEIEYHMPKITSATYVKSNQWTKADVLENARKSSLFILEIDNKLWTGKLESNLATFTITRESAK